LVKERVIYARERDFNLRLDGYYASKFVVLVLIALIQVALLLGIVRVWCGPGGSAFWQGSSLAVLAVAGTTLGLLISAVARTEEVAVALVPIAVMPQIILAGVIVPLSGLAKGMATAAITVHSAERSLESLLANSDLTLLHIDRADYRWEMAIMAAQVLAFATATFLALWVRGSRKE
jgi:ABC-type multidrug transport system permease subunit